ncbi:MAG: NUDIX domain-containing protein [Hyphomicrobiaceae bacterium]|nr:NUDIX domain-containing protein [Hyphomicrobiaceae bacterium]
MADDERDEAPPKPHLPLGNRGRVNLIDGRAVYHAASPYPEWDTMAPSGEVQAVKPFFRIDTYRFSHESHRLGDGRHEPVTVREVIERGDAVGVLLYNSDTRKVIVVKQFRLPVLDRGGCDGWIIETIAGVVPRDGSKTPEQVAVEETLCEAGYRINNPEPVVSFFSSPGGLSERIHVFFKEVSASDRVSRGGGDPSEDIEVVELSTDELTRKLRNRELVDPKLVIASYFLAVRLGLRLSAPSQLPDSEHPIHYAHQDFDGLKVRIKTGDILSVKDVDIWLNPENKYLMMARIIDRSISASIRWGGAEKRWGRQVAVDTIGNALRRGMNGRSEATDNEIIETEAGELRYSNNVRRLLHLAVASAQGDDNARAGVAVSSSDVRVVVQRALAEIHRGNTSVEFYLPRLRDWIARRGGRYRSVLVPLIGAGEGGLGAHASVKAILGGILSYCRSEGEKKLPEIYLLAFTDKDLEACTDELREAGFHQSR